jgi:hypothetical protein
MAAMKPKVREDLVVVEVDGEAVIYDQQKLDILHLNPTATIVFNLCDGSSTIKEMAGDIADAFQMPADQVERQVRSLIRDFKQTALLDGSFIPEHKHRSAGLRIVEKADDAKAEDAGRAEVDKRERTREQKESNP